MSGKDEVMCKNCGEWFESGMDHNCKKDEKCNPFEKMKTLKEDEDKSELLKHIVMTLAGQHEKESMLTMKAGFVTVRDCEAEKDRIILVLDSKNLAEKHLLKTKLYANHSIPDDLSGICFGEKSGIMICLSEDLQKVKDYYKNSKQEEV